MIEKKSLFAIFAVAVFAGSLISAEIDWSAIESKAKEVDASSSTISVSREQSEKKSEIENRLKKSVSDATAGIEKLTPPDSLGIDESKLEIDDEGDIELEQPFEIDEENLTKEKAPDVQQIKPNRFPLKNYVNIRYSKKLSWFSVVPHDRRGYEQVKKILGVTNFIEPSILRNYGTPKGTTLAAFYYDYIKKRPNIAENFYRRFPKLKKQNFYLHRLLLADYYVRTRRPLNVFKVLPAHLCNAQTARYPRKLCYYYRGVAKYITTGENRNKDLYLAMDTIKKAKKIYYGK